jgi:hypothetical protein
MGKLFWLEAAPVSRAHESVSADGDPAGVVRTVTELRVVRQRGMYYYPGPFAISRERSARFRSDLDTRRHFHNPFLLVVL